jgi:hypothetical protein
MTNNTARHFHVAGLSFLKLFFPNKKAPGKGGHHLAPFYPLTHPELLSEASSTGIYVSVRA